MSDKVSEFQVDFIGKFKSLFGHASTGFVEQQDPGRGPQPKLGAWELVTSLVYHVMNDAGRGTSRILGGVLPTHC